MAEIVEIDDFMARVWCWGTRYKKANSQPQRAVFKPVYTKAGGTIFLGKPRGASIPWTWDVRLDNISDVVVAQDIEIRDSGRLSAESVATVKRLQKRSLRVFA